MVELPFAVGVERSRLHGLLFAGDVVVVVVLLSAGMVRHGENPLVLFERAVLVIGPYVLGWLLAAALLGAYTTVARRSVGDAAANAAGSWFVAALVGSGLRATPALPGGAPPTYVAVVVGTGFVALVGWRAAVTVVVGPVGR
jgi:hypothetical protein